MKVTIALGFVFLCFHASLAWAGFPYSDRYELWSSNRPFPLGGLHLSENPVPTLTTSQRIERYQGAGLNQFVAVNVYQNDSNLNGAANVGLESQAVTGNAGTFTGFKNKVNYLESIGTGMTAISVFDEPVDADIPVIEERMDWVKQQYQGSGAITGATDPLVYANLSAPSIDIDQYITQTEPDILSYDRYPLLLNGSTDADYFAEMELVRGKSLQYNLPMWMIQQSYERTVEPGGGQLYRLPSESDMRFQAFSFMGHGGLGINFFGYQASSWSNAIITFATNQPSEVYYSIQDMAPEIEVLGTALRKLRPVGDVEFIGQAVSDFNGVTPFVATGANTLNNVEALDTGLVSYFQDEAGEDYFMLVNLKHGDSLDKSQTEDSMTLFFDPAVLAVERLNRLTGNVDILPTIDNPGEGNRYLSLVLEGGTGDLFKYNTGQPFAGQETFIAGDFDGNGTVDGFDFLKWQRDGLSASDLALWEANYGAISLVASASAVPEPSSYLLLLFAVTVLGSVRRHRSGENDIGFPAGNRSLESWRVLRRERTKVVGVNAVDYSFHFSWRNIMILERIVWQNSRITGRLRKLAKDSASTILFRKHLMLKAVIAISALLVMPGPAWAVLSLGPIADTRITPKSPDTNYGTDDLMFIGNSGVNDLDRGLFQFDVGAIPAAGDGTLFIQTFANFGFDGHSLDAYQMSSTNSGWLETQATWNNKNDSLSTPWDGGSHDSGSTFLGNSGVWTTGDTSSTITIPQLAINDAISNNGGILDLLLKSDSSEAFPTQEHILAIHLREIGDDTEPKLSFQLGPQNPIPLLSATEPGLFAPLTTDTDAVGWGKLTFLDPISGEWTHDSDGATIAGDINNNPAASTIRYRTTDENLNLDAVAMDPSKDWVFEVEWSSDNFGLGNTVFELISAGASPETFGGDILRFAATGQNDYIMIARGGQVGDAFQNLSSALFTVHYKAANSRLDFYIDGELQLEDFQATAGDGNYDLVFAQLRGGAVSPNRDTFKNLTIGVLGTSIGGDFDGNGVVDGNDFLKWQRDGLSATDLAIWEANYGRTNPTFVPISASTSVVPEPSGCSLLLFAITLLGPLYRQRSRK